MAQQGQPQQPQVWAMHPQYADHNRPLKNQYELKEELGKGGFGTVRRCIFLAAQGTGTGHSSERIGR